MSAGSIWPWVALALLGAWHGLNPGMGWLFAAALGMQEGKGSAAWRALPPLALGHALAVGGVVLLVMLAGAAFPASILRWTVATVLVGYGAFRMVRSAHPRYGGMKVGPRDLTVWSFLMASAHGAGLMVVPFLMGGEGEGVGVGGVVPSLHGAHMHIGVHGESASLSAASVGSPDMLEALAATLVHTGAYLLVTGLLAVLVVGWLGLRLLRSLWVDLDRIWAGALILTGVLTALL